MARPLHLHRCPPIAPAIAGNTVAAVLTFPQLGVAASGPQGRCAPTVALRAILDRRSLATPRGGQVGAEEWSFSRTKEWTRDIELICRRAPQPSGIHRFSLGGDRRFHSDGFQASKSILTRGTRLENGPLDAREKVRNLTGGSIAIMCPAFSTRRHVRWPRWGPRSTPKQ